MRLKNFILSGIKKSTLESSSLPNVVNFSDNRPNSPIAVGTLADGGLAYSFEVSDASVNHTSDNTNYFNSLKNMIKELRSPIITKKDLFDQFIIYEIDDYGNQTMSYGISDIVTYCFTSDGYKIPEKFKGVIRSFVNKKYYILFSKFIEDVITDEIQILVNFKRLKKNYSNLSFDMILTPDEKEYSINLNTYISKISETYLDNVSLLIDGNKNYNSDIFINMKINGEKIIDFVSRQINISNTQNVDYFKLLIKIISNVDLYTIKGGLNPTTEELNLTLENIFLNKPRITLNFKDEYDEFYVGRSGLNLESIFNDRSDYKIFISDVAGKLYSFSNFIPSHTYDYEIIPNFNKNVSIFLNINDFILNNEEEIINILKNNKIFFANNYNNIEIYNNKGYLSSFGDEISTVIVHYLYDENNIPTLNQEEVNDITVYGDYIKVEKNLDYSILTDHVIVVNNDFSDDNIREVFTPYLYNDNITNLEAVISGDSNENYVIGTGKTEINDYVNFNYDNIKYKESIGINKENLNNSDYDTIKENFEQVKKNLMLLFYESELDKTPIQITNNKIILNENYWFIVVKMENNNLFNIKYSEKYVNEFYCKVDNNSYYIIPNISGTIEFFNFDFDELKNNAVEYYSFK